MKENRLNGVLVPALTPFLPSQQPDSDAFIKHCHWLMDNGADGLAVFGTTSEANSMSCDERMKLLENVIASGISPERIMPGTGTCALTDSVRLSTHATQSGCAGVLMLPPFYYKGVSDEGIYSAYSEVIDQVGDSRLRIYLYHIPPMSQIGLSPQLIEKLIKNYPTVVVGIKDSGGDWAHTEMLLKEFPQLSVFPGSEAFLLSGMKNGGSGCITATGNVNPGGIRHVYENWREPDAEKLQKRITEVRSTIQAYAMIPALKVILADHTGNANWLNLRPPLVQLDQSKRANLMQDLENIGFTMADNALIHAA